MKKCIDRERMKIQTLLGINGYNLLVCHCSGNLYYLSIIKPGVTTYSFEGIYPTIQAAIERGKSVIENIESEISLTACDRYFAPQTW